MISSDVPGIRDVIGEVLAGVGDLEALAPDRLGELADGPRVIVLDACAARPAHLRRIATLVEAGHAVVVLDGGLGATIDHAQVRHLRVPVRAEALVAAVRAAREGAFDGEDLTWTDVTSDFRAGLGPPAPRWETVTVAALAPDDQIAWIAVSGQAPIHAVVEACRPLRLGTMSGSVVRTDRGLFWFPAATRVERRRRGPSP